MITPPERAAGCFAARLVGALVLGYGDRGVVALWLPDILDTILDTAGYNVPEIAGLVFQQIRAEDGIGASATITTQYLSG